MSGRRTRSAARLAGVAALLAAAVVSTAAASNPGSRAARLRVQAQTLDTRAHQALLSLYALDSRLRTARRQLAGLEAESRRLRTQQRDLAQQVAAAHATFLVSQEQFGEHLRALYEQGDVDPLAVVLGAQSLDDALTQLDDLSRVTIQNREVVAAMRSAQTRLGRLRTTLAAHRARVDAAVAGARAAASSLASARADRIAYIGSLHRQRQLATAQIGALETIASRVAKKSQTIQQASAPAEAAAPSTSTNAQGERTLVVSSTGYSLPGHTATGLPVGWGIVAVDPSVIPLGTKLTVPGYGEAVAADVGSGVRGAMIDLWFPTLAQARAWGRRTVTVTLH
ncbi:MAG TPA: 3D domain-containing protein [Gaiellaceae bacterium]|nr:3D domain-containing protein [Gaiellaceae bacterium]